MNLLQDTWKSLKFSAGDGISNLRDSVSWRFRSGKGDITYINNRAYKSVAVHAAKQMAVQAASAELQKLLPRYQKTILKQQRDVILAQQDRNLKKLVENRTAVNRELGHVYTSDGKHYVARDKYGAHVDTALMMYYEGEQEIEVNDVALTAFNDYFTTNYNTDLKRQHTVSFRTKTICHIDVLAEVSMSSGKNLVQTKVQGRDFSRKELVSGGDLSFQISGRLVADMGQYPTTEVQKLVMVAQHKGVVNVNHHLFKNLNVDRVIITDFALGKQDMYNEQPYTMSCVAVEPDEDVVITKDTIGVLNQELQGSEMSGWYKFVLDSKLAEVTTNMAAEATTHGVGALMDLIPNNKI